MNKINALAELIDVLTAAIGITVDSTIHVYPTRTGLQSSYVVLALDLLPPSPSVDYLLSKKLLLDNMDAFISVESGFDAAHGVFLEFSAAVVAELQRRDAAMRIAKLKALIQTTPTAPTKNVAHLQWAFNALGL